MLAISILLGALEWMARPDLMRADGLYSWSVLSTQYLRKRTVAWGRVVDGVFGFRGTFVLYGIQACCGIVLLVPASFLACLLAVGIALTSKLLIAYRSNAGADGSDQMEIVTLAGLFTAMLAAHLGTLPVGLWFIAAQLIVSYGASGVSKAVSKSWVSGDAALMIFNTYTYGAFGFANLLRKIPYSGVVLCWSVIFFECAFPISFFAPTSVLVPFLVLGIAFHFMNALIMGLNKFFWAFTSTYAAIFFCHEQLRAVLAR